MTQECIIRQWLPNVFTVVALIYVLVGNKCRARLEQIGGEWNAMMLLYLDETAHEEDIKDVVNKCIGMCKREINESKYYQDEEEDGGD